MVAGSKLFFKKIEVVNAENLPMNKPVILVANHQNAMMDPVMLCWMFRKQLHWLTRADVFKNPRVNKLLRSVNMLPVYRERDKVEDLHDINNKTFDESNRRLEHHAIMSMFPEGMHRGKKQLLPLKKGVARMAINAYNSGLHHVCVVPVGIDYENYHNYRTTMLVIVGKPINIESLLLQEPDQARAQNVLLTSIRSGLKKVMIDIEQDDIYEPTMAIEALCRKLSKSNSLLDQFSFFHKMVGIVNNKQEVRDKLKTCTNSYLQLQKSLKIEEKYFLEKGMSILKILVLTLAAIPSLLAILIYAPVYFLTEYIVKKIVKDPLFVNSIRICIWTFVTPVYLLLLGTIASLIAHSIWFMLPSIFCIFGCGIIALHWLPIRREFVQNKLCYTLQKEKNKDYNNWIETREELKNYITQLNSN